MNYKLISNKFPISSSDERLEDVVTIRTDKFIILMDIGCNGMGLWSWSSHISSNVRLSIMGVDII